MDDVFLTNSKYAREMRSMHDLLTAWPVLDIPAKRDRLTDTLSVRPGRLAETIDTHLSTAEASMSALWRRDPSLWSDDVSTQEKIRNRLGWLESPMLMADSVARLRAFAGGVKDDGFTDVVLLGMGGSSLAPEVLRQLVGVAPGWPAFHMLDSTDPAAVRAIDTPVERTLYLLASKSGTTIEPNSLAAHFRARLESGVPRWADHFVAITDAGTDLSRRAELEQFRDVFINPSDIGGRYSAVSFFGMVPASLMGQDIEGLIGSSLAMLALACPDDLALTRSAAVLGMVIGAAALAGRDKLTLVAPPALEAFGLWVEQLVAESTGKQGAGIVPIAGESFGAPANYGSDRLFVRLRPAETWRRQVPGDWGDEAYATRLQQLEQSGTPVVEIEMADPFAVGAEFIRWEIATALAGAMLKINPFDEPNVQQAKDATRVLLDRYKTDGRLPRACADQALPGGIGLELSGAARTALRVGEGDAILTLLGEGDYLAVLAYLGPDEAIAHELDAFRNTARNRTRAATMLGYGPRYLHSTGQLHKGGPNSGVFILITADPVEDVPIPGEAFSLGTLELAQGQGDFNSLDATGRRALHVHLPRPDAELVRRVGAALLARLSPEAA
jgi:glucose-6-phosphate isomerase